MSDDARFTSVDDLPDDPLSMPPPHWRSSGAIFHILAALDKISTHLRHLMKVNARTSRMLDRYYAKYPDGDGDGDLTDLAESVTIFGPWNMRSRWSVSGPF